MKVKIKHINTSCYSVGCGANVSSLKTSGLYCLLFICLLFSAAASAADYATLAGKVGSFDGQPLVIYLESVLKNKAAPVAEKQRAFISSHNNKFEPAFQVVVRGSVLEIKNTDSVFHNTHISENKITLFNVATPLKNLTVKKIMPRTGIFNVACDIHPWMNARLAVVTGDYYSVLWKPGRFQINNVIPGEYYLHFLQAENDEVITLLKMKAGDQKDIVL